MSQPPARTRAYPRRPPVQPKRRKAPDWMTFAMIAAPLGLFAALLLIAGIGVMYLIADATPVATPIPPTPTIARIIPPYGLQITVYDPIRDETVQWNVAPETWGAWLIAADPTDPLRPPILLNETAVRAYLSAQEAALGADRRLEISEAVSAVQTTIAGGLANPRLRAYHRDRPHVVQPGETIISIAWDYGIPYPYVQAANGGIDSLSVGQTITIPSPDEMLRLPVIPNKRIVVSIPNQTVKVYEDGALKWDWVASTGIASSPTWTGVYQVLTHDPNAYASNWNLWMPDFLGVYYPVPGADFINGFHGFPTRGGSQLLWTGDLGTRVTYGCILVSSDNARLLYDWAEDGVVVEIQG